MGNVVIPHNDSTDVALEIATFLLSQVVLTAFLNEVIPTGIAVPVSAFLVTYQSVGERRSYAHHFEILYVSRSVVVTPVFGSGSSSSKSVLKHLL